MDSSQLNPTGDVATTACSRESLGREPRGREPLSLRRLFPSASFVGCADIHVFDATEHAGECAPGMLYAARPGIDWDGIDFTDEAIAHGASALMVDRPLPDVAVSQCVLNDVGKSYGVLMANLRGRPMRTVRTVGVTGTNGKSSVTWFIRSMLRSAGKECGLLGSIEYDDGLRTEPAVHTTPETRELWNWMAAMARRRTSHAAVELSSQALHQDLAAGAELEMAVVTNISHDHLDYHGTAAGYAGSKAKILSLVRPGGTVVLNQDDASIDRLRPRVPTGVDVTTIAIRRRAAITASHLRRTPDGTRFMMSLRGRPIAVETSLAGRHNVMNCLAAVAVCERFGLTIEEITRGLSQLTSPPGRMERVGNDVPFDVFVDHAHTPDALRKAIAAARSLASGRVIVVAGAGGERDRMKRPLLGRAMTSANIAILTTDNPRSEDPAEIVEEILEGFGEHRFDALVELDRETAIRTAVEMAAPGDVVLIAGKGHETTQEFADFDIPFDDRLVAADALEQRGEPVVLEPVAA